MPRLHWANPIVVARFLSKLYVVPGSDCIECRGDAPLGWVRFWANDFPGCAGSKVYAHRYAFAIMRGPLDAETTLDHLCRNRGCVNVYHLEPLTREEHGQKSRADQIADDDPWAVEEWAA